MMMKSSQLCNQIKKKVSVYDDFIHMVRRNVTTIENKEDFKWGRKFEFGTFIWLTSSACRSVSVHLASNLQNHIICAPSEDGREERWIYEITTITNFNVNIHRLKKNYLNFITRDRFIACCSEKRFRSRKRVLKTHSTTKQAILQWCMHMHSTDRPYGGIESWNWWKVFESFTFLWIFESFCCFCWLCCIFLY